MENTTEAEAILAAGVAISKNVGVLKDGSITFAIVPDGYKVSSLENICWCAHLLRVSRSPLTRLRSEKSSVSP